MCADCEDCNYFGPSLKQEPANLKERKSFLQMQPMEHVSTDLYHVDGRPYTVLVDRFSSFIWTEKLKDETTVIEYMEKIFYQLGFPKKKY